MYHHNKFTKLCTNLARWNEKLETRGKKKLELIVCAIAHAEKILDLKQAKKDLFDRKVILDGITSKGLVVHPVATERPSW